MACVTLRYTMIDEATTGDEDGQSMTGGGRIYYGVEKRAVTTVSKMAAAGTFGVVGGWRLAGSLRFICYRLCLAVA